MNAAPFCIGTGKNMQMEGISMKKMLAMLLALAMLLTLTGSCAVAEEKIHLTGMCWGSTAQYEQLVADVLATNRAGREI